MLNVTVVTWPDHEEKEWNGMDGWNGMEWNGWTEAVAPDTKIEAAQLTWLDPYARPGLLSTLRDYA